MKKLIVSSLLFVSVSIGSIVFLSSFHQASEESSIRIIRVYESSGVVTSGTTTTPRSAIVISDGATIIKTVELEDIKSKSVESNLLKITAAIDELKGQGYTVTTSNSSGATIHSPNSLSVNLFFITTYVLEKK